MSLCLYVFHYVSISFVRHFCLSLVMYFFISLVLYVLCISFFLYVCV